MGCDIGVRLQTFGYVPISIHAPTWGATRVVKTTLNPFDHFNPRTHVGCDLRELPQEPEKLISIHAPTWGATLDVLKMLSDLQHFNPRTHVGCDTADLDFQETDCISIHAPTWGATENKSYICNS